MILLNNKVLGENMRKYLGILKQVTDEDLELLINNPKEFWKDVTEIDNYAFAGCKKSYEITIPNHIKKIGPYAFDNCHYFKSIVLPKNITEIERGTFRHCIFLNDIVIPKTVTKIGDDAFLNTNLRNIVLPEGVTEIGERSFSECRNLENITLPKSLSYIGKSAFCGCHKLEQAIIQSNISIIEPQTFKFCENLENITLPKSITSIGTSAFEECKSLKEIVVPENVSAICDNAFGKCSNLKSVILPKNLTEIGDSAFSGCESLENIVIPDGVTEINREAFFDCCNLKSVSLPKSLKKIGDNAFGRCYVLENIILPESLEEIGLGAFLMCENLKNITIPDNIKSIGRGAFLGCSNLSIKYKNISIEKDCFLQFLVNHDFSEDSLKKYERLINSNVNIPLFKEDELDKVNVSLWKKLSSKFLPDIMDTKDINELNVADFNTLAKNLGLFDSESKIKAKSHQGKEIELPVNDLAYKFLQKFINDVPIENMHIYLQGMEGLGQNKEFLMFLNNKNNYDALIAQVENHNEGILTQIYEWFIEREKLELRQSEDDSNLSNIPTGEQNRYKIRTYDEGENGVEKTRWKSPTIELLMKEFASKRFAGITTAREREIADNFANIYDYKQKHFDKAKEIDKEREESGVPDFIVGKHIGQNRTQAYKEYFALTEALRDETLRNAEEIMENQVDVSNKIFTYDTLAKSDIANFSIGFMASCCAKLYGAGAGAMRGSIISKDMQPLVVKNSKDEIVAYSVLYINREQGYAVLNDIEVNTRYMGHDEELKIIYEKMRRCAIENIEEYNKTATLPVSKINCGISPNWKAVNKYVEANPKSPILSAPDFDDFNYVGSGSWSGDWHRSQYTIWTLDEMEK